MQTTLTLDDQHFQTVAAKARELGTTPEGYVESLIDAANVSFDDLLAPAREGFRRSGATEEDLDAAVAEARRAIREKRDQARRNRPSRGPE